MGALFTTHIYSTLRKKLDLVVTAICTKHEPKSAVHDSGVLQFLVEAAKSPSLELSASSCTALAQVCHTHSDNTAYVLAHGVAAHLTAVEREQWTPAWAEAVCKLYRSMAYVGDE